MKVIHLPTTVGGNPQSLSRHLSESGIKSETWTLYQNYFAFPADRVIVGKNDNPLVAELKKLMALCYVFRFDVVFFNFGSTLFQPIDITKHNKRSPFIRILLRIYNFYLKTMQMVELLLLRALRRPFFMQYQGDDARQGDFCQKNFAITFANRVEPTYYSNYSDRLKRNQIKLLTVLARKTYALNPDLLHVLPEGSEFLPYCHISLNDYQPNYNQTENRPLRFGHAPSHRGVKGTDLIISAADSLHKKGYRFELVLVEGMSHTEAKECYRNIDVMIDQLFAGWYGGLAVEAMALGKPVIVYIRDEDLKFIPEQMRHDLPFFRAIPGTIEDVMTRVLEMPRAELVEAGRISRAFVDRWHDPHFIARKIRDDILRTIGSEK